jgi:hypothetical protein
MDRSGVLAGMSDYIGLVVRRFVQTPLSGNDLAKIREDVLRLSQSELGEAWNLSRNKISGAENALVPDRRMCDLYLGAMVRAVVGRTATANPAASTEAVLETGAA